MKPEQKTKALAVIALSALFAGGCAGPITGLVKKDYQEVGAVGLSRYDAGDVNASESLALFEAQKNAVKKTAELFLGESSGAFWEKPENPVLKSPQVYLKKYEILEAARYGKYYSVKILARVNTELLEKAVRESVGRESGKLLRLMIAARKVMSGETVVNGVVGETARKIFGKEIAVLFVEVPFEVRGNFFSDPMMQLNAVKSARADLLFIAEGSAEKISASTGGFFPFSARVDVRLMDFNSGEVIFKDFASSSIVDVRRDRAAAKSLQMAARLACEKAVPALKKATASAVSMKLRLENAEDFDKLKKFADFVSSMEKVKEVFLERWSDDTADFEIKTSMSAEELASSVLRGNLFPLSFEKSGRNEVAFKLAK